MSNPEETAYIEHLNLPFNLVTIAVNPSFEPSLLIHLRAREPRDPKGLKGCYLYCQSPIPGRSRSSSQAEEAQTDAREKPVPPEESAQIIRMLENVRLHAWIADPMQGGLDGTRYELIFGSLGGGAHYWWWVKPPAGWEVLDDVVRRLMKLASAP